MREQRGVIKNLSFSAPEPSSFLVIVIVVFIIWPRRERERKKKMVQQSIRCAVATPRRNKRSAMTWADDLMKELDFGGHTECEVESAKDESMGGGGG